MLVKSQVKYIQSLSQKKFRDEEDVFVAEGPKIINELLAGNAVPLQALYATEDWLSRHAGLIPPTASSAIQQVTDSELERISFLTTPNEVLGVFKKPRFVAASDIAEQSRKAKRSGGGGQPGSSQHSGSDRESASGRESGSDRESDPVGESNLPKRPDGTLSLEATNQASPSDQSLSQHTSLTLVLDNIQDPGNLGTIIRCADWFGVKRIICSPKSADNFSPKVVQSTMASIVRVAVSYMDLPKFLESNQQLTVYAAALNGKPLKQFGNVNDGIIVIGNESKGISDEVLAFATERITIPRHGAAESLNAAVATGIILSHLVG